MTESACELLRRVDPALMVVAWKLDEPNSIGFVTVRPNLGAEDASGRDSLVLLFEIAVREQLDELRKSGLSEFGLNAVRPGRNLGRVDRRRVGGEPVGDVLAGACRGHRALTPVA